VLCVCCVCVWCVCVVCVCGVCVLCVWCVVCVCVVCVCVVCVWCVCGVCVVCVCVCARARLTVCELEISKQGGLVPNKAVASKIRKQNLLQFVTNICVSAQYIIIDYSKKSYGVLSVMVCVCVCVGEVCTYIRTGLCMYVCVFLCMYICMYVCMCMYVYMHFLCIKYKVGI
jgi:hypothetical protein